MIDTVFVFISKEKSTSRKKKTHKNIHRCLIQADCSRISHSQQKQVINTPGSQRKQRLIDCLAGWPAADLNNIVAKFMSGSLDNIQVPDEDVG